MAYIGNQIRQYSDRVVLDSLTASATANYTLQLNGSNYVPSSAESLTVSLNGVIQKPQNSYTVSGSTLSFASALTASDSIDFVIAERGITLQTPSAGSVNTEQLANNSVTAAKLNGLGNYVVEKITDYSYSTNVSTTADTDYLDIAGGNTINFTPTSTNDIIHLSGACLLRASAGTSGAGLGIMRGTSSSITSSDTVVMRNGRYGNLYGTSYNKGTIEVLETNLTAGTTVYYEMFGMAYFGTGITYFNYGGINNSANAEHKLIGTHYKYIG